MALRKGPLSGKELLDLYFIENRARILEIASFLDRVDRAADSARAKEDFRYKAFVRALGLLVDPGDRRRTKTIQLSLSDLSTKPTESAAGPAVGAWEGSIHEDH